MFSFISTILLAINLFNIGGLPEKPKPEPTCTCSIAKNAFTGNTSDFSGCATGVGITPCDCTNCQYFELQLQCNDGCSCCVDYITFSSGDSRCFEACARLNTPTAPWWVVDVTRDNICTSANLTLSAASGPGNLCTGGGVLSVKFCGPSGTYSYQAHTVNGCAGLGGVLTGTITIP